MTQQNPKLFALAALAALGLSASSAFAQVTDIVVDATGEIPYVVDGRNVVARSGTGLCWRTGYWTPAAAGASGAAGCACDGDVLPKEQCSAPVATPEAPEPVTPLKKPVNEKVKLPADVLFDFDKDVLKPEGEARLNELAAQAKQIKLEVILAVGHTDRLGSEVYNRRLSDRRAVAVRNYLIAQGVDPNRIYIEGKGKSQPVTGTQCSGIKNRKALITCLQPDRRVEVEVLGTTTR